jgi:transcriptional regulator with XRE-family HTH domain
MDLGLRQSDLAERIGGGTSTVNYWENDHFNPKAQYMSKVIDVLGYDPFGVRPARFPTLLKATRIAAGLTRRQLAAGLGVHPGTVAEWERGEARPVRTSQARLKALLGITQRP